MTAWGPNQLTYQLEGGEAVVREGEEGREKESNKGIDAD